MTTVLAIASDPALDTDLVEEVRTTHPDRVTVLSVTGEAPRPRALAPRATSVIMGPPRRDRGHSHSAECRPLGKGATIRKGTVRVAFS